MKSCSTELATLLSTAREFFCNDLFKLTLSNNQVYYIADSDRDIVYQNRNYSHDSFIMQRSNTKITGEPTVDSLTVTIKADREHGDTVANKYILLAAHDGTLDDSYLTLTRAYFDKDTGALLGGIEIFTGRCSVQSCGGISCQLQCQSECTGLNASFPTRTFAPQNVYQESSGGGVVTSSTDKYTCMIPLKPSRNVLVRL